MRFVRQAFWLTVTVVQALGDTWLRPRKSVQARAEWAHRWAGLCLRRLGVRCDFVGELPNSGMVVSNHLGYLDIMVYLAAMRCVFVSKAEVKSWPVFGSLASLGGTIYVDRKRRTDTRNANDGIRGALREGLPVVIFPEGTSTGGGEVLPFYPSLFEPAVESGMPIRTAYLSYEVEGGSVEQDVAYWGTMRFFPHLLRLLRLKEIRATVKFTDEPRVYGDRKIAAMETRKEVLRLRSGEAESLVSR